MLERIDDVIIRNRSVKFPTTGAIQASEVTPLMTSSHVIVAEEEEAETIEQFWIWSFSETSEKTWISEMEKGTVGTEALKIERKKFPY